VKYILAWYLFNGATIQTSPDIIYITNPDKNTLKDVMSNIVDSVRDFKSPYNYNPIEIHLRIFNLTNGKQKVRVINAKNLKEFKEI
jgi:hypothetical protein